MKNKISPAIYDKAKPMSPCSHAFLQKTVCFDK